MTTTQENTLSPEVAFVSRMRFVGNIHPFLWYKNLRLDSGKPNLPAITILGEIAFQFRGVETFEEGGDFRGLVQRFKGEWLRRNRSNYESLFGLSNKQAGDALKFLEARRLIVRNIVPALTLLDGRVLSNVPLLKPKLVPFFISTYFDLSEYSVEELSTDQLYIDLYKAFQAREITPELKVDPVRFALDAKTKGLRPEVAESTDADRFFGYRDEVLKYYQQAFDHTLRTGGKEALVALSQEEDFSKDIFRASVDSCVQSGVRPGNVSAIIDTYRAGGNYRDLFGDKIGLPEETLIALEPEEEAALKAALGEGQ